MYRIYLTFRAFALVAPRILISGKEKTYYELRSVADALYVVRIAIRIAIRRVFETELSTDSQLGNDNPRVRRTAKNFDREEESQRK